MDARDLLSRLNDAEDNFVERKSGSAKRDEIRRTVVAFANSVPEGRAAILFLGIRDDGKFDAIPNSDKLQKTVREICEQDCYPPIKFSAEVLMPEGGPILAVVVPASINKPHFAGPAYTRRGSESVVASAEIFEELVSSRNSKCSAILNFKEKVISVIAIQHKLGLVKPIPGASYREKSECRIEKVDTQTVRLRIIGSDRYVTEPLDHVKVSYDEERQRPMLIVTMN